jgi:nicotinamidase-related amidase
VTVKVALNSLWIAEPMNLLITQCLQKDFVQPLGKRDPLPNELHIGFSESNRLANSDVSHFIQLCREQNIQLLHIRDWHCVDEPEQAVHLERFGEHCIQDSDGADFVFKNDPSDIVIDATTLNDFHHTDLESALNRYPNDIVNVGVIGVWTEAKITFLLYELLTRYPHFNLATCSALTASSSRHKHFLALEHIQTILGVTVYDSVGEFAEFLTGKAHLELPVQPSRFGEIISFAEEEQFDDEEKSLMQLLFVDSKEIHYQLLDGGFSGNKVLLVTSKDVHGHEQTPHVVKIGKRSEIANERISFEKIETVMGNNAPQIVDFIDLANKGAIKYRYASMSGSSPVTLQKLYQSNEPLSNLFIYLDEVFDKQLDRFYKAAQAESVNLLNYYQFSSKWAESVADKVLSIINKPFTPKLTFENGRSLTNISLFYSEYLNSHIEPIEEYQWSFIHGDLNGANILIESNNVWLIDFFHTHRGHILKDLIKFENDLLYIFTAINTQKDLSLAYAFSEQLYGTSSIEDIAPMHEQEFKSNTNLYRAACTVNKLRSYITRLTGDNSHIRQLWIGQLRYAVHTLGFDECNEYQKKWALYSACLLAERIQAV